MSAVAGGRPLDALGHEQRARQQVCWGGEGGRWSQLQPGFAARQERVRMNVFVRDMDLAYHENLDGRRLEVVADGLPLHGGAQLAIDTTMVSPLHSNGVARRGASDRKGLALEVARKRKEMTYPELAGEGGRARLVVLAIEVGGRAQFLSSLAWTNSRDLPEELQGDAARA